MQTPTPPYFKLPSDEYKFVDEQDILKTMKLKQWLGGLVQVLYPSGRVFSYQPVMELARISPGGWFRGITRKGKLWGVLLCVPPASFIHRRDGLNGWTRFQRLEYDDKLSDRRWQKKVAERQRKLTLAASNGNIRRIRELRAGGEHNEPEWQRLLAACGFKCLRCGTQENLTKDHIVPVASGGNNYITNLQPLCRSCNSWKGPKTIDFRDHSSPEIAKILRPHEFPRPDPGGEGQQGHADAGAPCASESH